jgi:hypothetical protein
MINVNFMKKHFKKGDRCKFFNLWFTHNGVFWILDYIDVKRDRKVITNVKIYNNNK